MTTQVDAALETLDGLAQALAEVLSPTLTEAGQRAMSNDQFLVFTRLVESIGRRVDAARVIGAAEMERRTTPDGTRLVHALGCTSATEALTRLTGVSTATARARLRASRPIAPSMSLTGEHIPAAFPRLRTALEEGKIGIDSVTAITTTLGPISTRCHPTELAAAEEELVGAAVGAAGEPSCDADTLRCQAQVWALVLDPDGVLPEYERAARRRGFTLGRVRDGLIPVTGGLLPDVAAQLQRLFDANMSPRVAGAATEHTTTEGTAAKDTTTGGTATESIGSTATEFVGGPRFVESHEPDEFAEIDTRTRAQKQHDALAAILGVAARSTESPSIGGAAPALLVTISAAELEAENGVAFVDGTDQHLPAAVARRIACSHGTQRVVLSDDGRIIELGSPQRVFTGHQRRAITVRDGNCIIPGCHVPAVWCEVHHTIEHSRGGPTHVDFGVLLCWHHHRTLETSGWRVRMVDGIPEVKAPRHIDPLQLWRPVRRSAAVEFERRRRKRAG
ncbi:DUF222 domain-containing protein [Microbacterium sp. NPDC055910]|uniref:HNH endonuclease signature motif containing protein n=1 Tax=Microbacterium sp. NPDC055910 TaxID=3345659 RepID=UPI0035DD350B